MANVTKTIPTSQGSFWKCSIDGVTYEYKAGATVSVPDYVAAIIDNELRQNPTYDDPTVRLTTEISDASTDKEVPSAKAVKKALDALEGKIPTVPVAEAVADATSDTAVDTINAIIDSLVAAGLMKVYAPVAGE